MKRTIFIYLFVFIFLTVPVFGFSSQSSVSLRSLSQICSAIRTEFYAPVSERRLIQGAIDEISKKYNLKDVGISESSEAFAILTDIFRKYPDDSQKLWELSVRGMLKSLDDPYSLFLDSAQWTYFRKVSSGKEVVGIGVEIAVKNGEFTIVSPIEGGNAEKSGVLPGDIILKVAGQNIAGMDETDVLNLFDGSPGTFLKLAVRRGNQIKNFKIKRAEISLKPPKASLLKSGITAGYLKISYFSENTDEEVKSSLQKIKNAGIKNLIIDLRNNPGGDFMASVRLASMFVGRKNIVISMKKGGNSEYIKGTCDSLFSFNTIILINNGSASASEIFAGALQDYKQAVLIGESSFGKALIQSVYSFPGNTGCKITTARYYTAKGQDILNKGLRPDIRLVDSSPSKDISKDEGIKAALKELSRSR